MKALSDEIARIKNTQSGDKSQFAAGVRFACNELEVSFKEPDKQTDKIVQLLLELSEDDRCVVFGQFCHECGSSDPRCQCWNDE